MKKKKTLLAVYDKWYCHDDGSGEEYMVNEVCICTSKLEIKMMKGERPRYYLAEEITEKEAKKFVSK
jgi:hypothetical protein